MTESFKRTRSITVAAGLSAYFFVFFVRTALTVVQPDLQSSFGLTASHLEKVLKAIRSLIIEDMAKDMPMLALTLELLQSIPGIGLISAVTILAEIGDFSAFSKPGKLVAYFGIDPSVMQSGEFTGTQNKMSKRGSRLLRRVLFTIALANIRTKRDKTAYNPVLMEYYKNKCQSKPKKVALGAVMRKLVNYIFAVLRDRKPYELRSPQEHAQMLAAKHTAA